MRAWCLFEQSGTFKQEFIKLGVEAVDVDILNQFGQTDIQADLFAEIEKGYSGEPSLFDGIGKDDIAMAFFPCTRFTTRHYLNIKCGNYGCNGWSDRQRVEYSMRMFGETNRNYQLIGKLFCIALDRGFALVVENPRANVSILNEFFPIEPKVIHQDRSKLGDYFRKPTQYWFVNTEPRKNFLFENLERCDGEVRKINDTRSQVDRSMISPVYASRFIREYLLPEEE